MRTLIAAAAVLMFAEAAFAAGAPQAKEIIAQVLDADPWGLAGAEVDAEVVLRDKRDATSNMAFHAVSKKHDGPLAKSLVRFSAPADVKGAGFLQTQKKDGDDDRHLFLPELKRARRISGSIRANAFMGTDFSFADLDRRDLRDGDSAVTGEEKIGKHACWVLKTTPKDGTSEYGQIEIWVRQDNHVPLRMKLYDKAKTLLKTFSAEEVRRVSGRWFITKSKMVNHREQHQTELTLSKVQPRDDVPDDEFTVRNLEKQ
jgi:hypothetical protein